MEKTILFFTEEVKAILEEKKTQTRRVIKPPKCTFLLGLCKDGLNFGICGSNQVIVKKPSYQGGEVLWVRETWANIEGEIQYKADTGNKYPGEWPEHEKDNPDCPRWRPSIHMPKEAARIFLDVKNIRVERLQDITEEDAIAEGVIYGQGERRWTARSAFMDLWDTINKKRGYGWETNPWVWVIEFKKVESEV